MLSESTLMDILRQGLLASVQISAPVLGVGLAAGLAIGLIQALTSIQELTLTFVPKLGAILIAFWMSMGMMTRILDEFFSTRIIPLIANGGT